MAVGSDPIHCYVRHQEVVVNIYHHRRRYVLAGVVGLFFTITEAVKDSSNDVATTAVLFFSASFFPVALAHLLDMIAEVHRGE